ncbi:hypothetical protein PYCC9005_003825 [Savitreella phatthalungensis]
MPSATYSRISSTVSDPDRQQAGSCNTTDSTEFGAALESRTQARYDAEQSHELSSSFEPPTEEEEDEEGYQSTRDAAGEGRRLLAVEPDPAQFGIVSQSHCSTAGIGLTNAFNGAGARDGVFANMSAKPEVHNSEREKDEHPPTYEQASLDNAPPYWDSTMYLPGVGADEVFIDGLPVGHFFGFLWNMLVSMSFQFVGFLLTYVLHTTHASKHGSRAGLGITLIQYGFYLRTPSTTAGDELPEDGSTSPHSFRDALGSRLEIAAYVLIIAGWLLLTKSTADFLRVRRMEQCVRETSANGTSAAQTINTPEEAV